MITAQATVRRARMSGYVKNKRKIKGDIFLSRAWIGKEVIIVPVKDFLQLKRQLRRALTQLKVISKESHEYFSA